MPLSLDDEQRLGAGKEIFSGLIKGDLIKFNRLERGDRRYSVGEMVVGIVKEAPTNGVANIRRLTADQVQRLVKGEKLEVVVGAGSNGPEESVAERDIVGLLKNPPAFLLG